MNLEFKFSYRLQLNAALTLKAESSSASYLRREQINRQKSTKGASINYIDKQGGGGWSPKCQPYYISLFSKLVNEGWERGITNTCMYSKFCQRSLWMPPNDVYPSSESTIWINDFFSHMNNSFEWKTTN